ncbi:MAG: alpha/beta fold hydrolase, partial [Ilumatobacter sp.]|uniref:alpha/beta fold hydrolase n=1 Tax=Ilumatobacter sp. TaxID=1967498 RepID=UPI00329A210C
MLDVPSHDGTTHRWHVLDTGEVEGTAPTATIVCVHGNPTWGYAWKSFLAEFSGRHRVIAVDQLGMGYSDRVGLRRYADRVADLGDVVDSLEVATDSPLVLAAHDWGGAVAMGWAVDHADRVSAMVLCNTGIGVPEGRGAPRIIRLAASRALRDLVCRRTNAFVEGTVRLSGSRITATDRRAFRAPYRRAEHRGAIADFVGDIPLASTVPPHPSEAALRRVSDLLPTIEAPVLLAWGAKDIVFDDDFADDLARRLPNSSLQRFPDANHLVMAEADVAGAVDTWLDDLLGGQVEERPVADAPATSVFAGIERRRDEHDLIADADLAARDTIDFATFARRVDGVAASLIERGLRTGDRVAMLTPPGIDLLVAVYGVWRAGGVTVVADRGLGLSGLGGAVKSAQPAWTIGPRQAALASSILRWAPRGVHVDVGELMGDAGAPTSRPSLPPPPDASCEAAVLFTSGATGPAKGVRYTHAQLAAQRDALASTYAITDDDRLVAAFAPFALYGPSLGVPTALTDCDVTSPGDLTVDALD